jgi:hypothetical protein
VCVYICHIYIPPSSVCVFMCVDSAFRSSLHFRLFLPSFLSFLLLLIFLPSFLVSFPPPFLLSFLPSFLPSFFPPLFPPFLPYFLTLIKGKPIGRCCPFAGGIRSPLPLLPPIISCHLLSLPRRYLPCHHYHRYHHCH